MTGRGEEGKREERERARIRVADRPNRAAVEIHPNKEKCVCMCFNVLFLSSAPINTDPGSVVAGSLDVGTGGIRTMLIVSLN